MSTYNLRGIVRQRLCFHSRKSPPGDRSHWCCWEIEPDLAEGLSVLLSGSEHEPDPVTHLSRGSHTSTFTMGPCLCPQLPLLSLPGPCPPHQPPRATPTHTATSSVFGVPEHQLSGVRVRGSAGDTLSLKPQRPARGRTSTRVCSATCEPGCSQISESTLGGQGRGALSTSPIIQIL